jgi:hypothetical protein
MEHQDIAHADEPSVRSTAKRAYVGARGTKRRTIRLRKKAGKNVPARPARDPERGREGY